MRAIGCHKLKFLSLTMNLPCTLNVCSSLDLTTLAYFVTYLSSSNSSWRSWLSSPKESRLAVAWLRPCDILCTTPVLLVHPHRGWRTWYSRSCSTRIHRYDVRRTRSRIHRVIHCNADVCLPQCRCVVHAITSTP